MELRPLIGFFLSSVVRFVNREGVAKRYRFPSCFVILICVTGLLNVTVVEAQDSMRIDRVKAAFVLNIARFVTWPTDSPLSQSDSMQLCLYRDNPMQEAMLSIAGEKIGGRAIEVRQVQSLTTSDTCSILLIASGELQTFFNEVPPDFKRPILTIADLTETDLPVESRRGILIALIRNGSRIAFEINLEKSRQTGLRMSSELLKLANIVSDND